MGKKTFIPAFLEFRFPWVFNFNSHWSRVLCTDGRVCLQENLKHSFKQWPTCLSVYELKMREVWHCNIKHQEEQWGDPKLHFSFLNCWGRNEPQWKEMMKELEKHKKTQQYKITAQVRSWSILTEHNKQENVLRQRWWQLWSIKSSLQASDSPSTCLLMLGYDSKLYRGMVTTWDCSQFHSSKGVQECKTRNVLELCELRSEEQQDCLSDKNSNLSNLDPRVSNKIKAENNVKHSGLLFKEFNIITALKVGKKIRYPVSIS